LDRANFIARLRQTVEERDTLPGRIFDSVVQGLIVISSKGVKND
jgi:hypothetical protein